MTIDEVVALIERHSEPGKMTKSQALDYIEGIVSELEMRAEALREEMDEE